ncbi:MAG: PKD domain-containing protein [Candidatus Bathyarchaeota archaeon]
MNVLLTDAPVELSELNITITDVEVHKSGENGEGGAWLVLVEDVEITFNLLDYQNGKTLELASKEIPSGNYTKIRLFVSEANASYKQTPDDIVELKVPPGKIDVITQFELFDEGTRTVTIDMEPNWIAISNSNTLRPVLKATISEENPPIAEFTYDPEDPIIDQTITFDASISTDIDGAITTYEWNLGDGSDLQTGVEITHTYTIADEYEVTLTVTDDTGLKNIINKPVNIQDPPST